MTNKEKGVRAYAVCMLFVSVWVICMTLFSSCSPERRIQRFLRNNPEFAAKDTIRDTVIVNVNADRIDSAIVMYVHDTIRIDTGRLHIQLIRTATGTPCDTVLVPIEVNGVCDTLRIPVPFEKVVEKIEPCPEGRRVAAWYRPAFWTCAGIITLLILAVVFGGYMRSLISKL